MSALTVETRELRAALLQTQQQLAMFTRAPAGAPPATLPTWLHVQSPQHSHIPPPPPAYTPIRMHHQRAFQFQQTFISRQHTLNTDVVVDNVALAVTEEVAGHTMEDKAMLQRPQRHQPMEKRYQQPI